jgi:hypothetical protein
MSKKNPRSTRINWTRVIVVTIRALSGLAAVAVVTYGG